MLSYLDFWQQEYGDATEARDFTGRTVVKDRFGQYGHRYGWVIEQINPNGALIESNMHIVNAETESVRNGAFSFWDGAVEYVVTRTPNCQEDYDYARKDFSVISTFKPDFWTREFGDCSEAVDFAGQRVVRDAQLTDEGAWNIDHIRPLARGGLDRLSNMQIVSVAVNAAKADRLRFTYKNKKYAVKRCKDVSERDWNCISYRYEKKDYCIVEEK